MYNIDMSVERCQQDRSRFAADIREASKNQLVPGARIIRAGAAVPAYEPETGCQEWLYPLSEVNDLGLFAYVEKAAETDQTHPWAARLHPDINLYYYILEGSGVLSLGGIAETASEQYAFGVQELVIIPREMTYRMAGEWKAICFHTRTGVYGTAAGTVRFPHPVVTLEHPAGPAADGGTWKVPGVLTCYNPIKSLACSFGTAVTVRQTNIEAMEAGRYNRLYQDITPVDPQTNEQANQKEALENAAILGARVLVRKDAPPVYNANAGLRQSSYPLTWTDDIGICNLAEKLAASDQERPFDSHSHPDIEEYKYILSGSGCVTIGVGDETCEEEHYEFQAGDLVILPRGLPHVDAGGYTALYFHAKQSVFGKTPGDSLYPHIAYVYTKPPRPTKEEEDALNEPGTYIKMNSRETCNVYCPNPILRIEKNPTDMTHLRPDLFQEQAEMENKESSADSSERSS